MTTFDEILIIANQLANQGKKPTVALVKSKLTNTFPLPTIIKVLKSWQHQPEFIRTSEIAARKSVLTTEMKEVDAIELIVEKALIPIKAELDDIKSQLASLIANKVKNRK
ncbi:MAG: hypothetical protein ACI9LM_002403 [Alteromonadaceae bacterium]|jgi:hypothetical protein